MLARRFPGPVLTGERRVEARAATACARFGVDTLVLDDGFQHRALARDADLVLARRRSGGAPAPAGRVAARAARRAARARAPCSWSATATPAWPPLPPALPRFRGRLRRGRAGPRRHGTPGGEEPLDALAGAAGRRGRRRGAPRALRRDARALRRPRRRPPVLSRPPRLRRRRRRGARRRPGAARPDHHREGPGEAGRPRRRSMGCARCASALEVDGGDRLVDLLEAGERPSSGIPSRRAAIDGTH